MRGMRAPVAIRGGDSTVRMEPPMATPAVVPIPTTDIIMMVRPT